MLPFSVFQTFGVIKYRIVGIDSGPTYFQIDEDTGRITLRSSVAQDTTIVYTVSFTIKLGRSSKKFGPGLSLGGNLGEKVSLIGLISCYCELREKFKCIEHNREIPD